MLGPRPVCRAVVFDLDGTLVDTMSAILRNYVETIRALGGAPVSTQDVLGSFHIGPTPVLLQHFLGRSVTPDELDRYYAGYDRATAGLEPFAGVRDMLRALGADGYAIGLFTSAARRAVDILLRKTNLRAPFSALVAGDDVTELKPAPEGLLLACDKLGIPPDETAHVGDADVDHACATRAGAFAIHAAWGASPADVSGYREVVHDPGDLIDLLRRPGQ